MVESRANGLMLALVGKLVTDETGGGMPDCCDTSSGENGR
jgi:hypothetical protein